MSDERKVPVHELADHEGNLDTMRLMRAFEAGRFRLYGMSMTTIRQLRHDYLNAHGYFPPDLPASPQGDARTTPNWLSEEFDDPPSCPKCGLMVGVCAEYPNCPAGQPASPQESRESETPETDGLRNFIRNGCSAREEDKHHALATIDALERRLRAAEKGKP